MITSSHVIQKPVLTTKNMKNRLLHAFIILERGKLSVIPLTTKYHIKPQVEADGQLGLFIHETDDEAIDNPVVVKQAVDSITVTFGMNGGGKTRLLLNVCNTISRTSGTRPLGIIWEASGRLLFDPGSNLRKIEIRYDGKTVNHRIFDGHDLCGAAFYTTSPFEAARRRMQLLDSETLDITPSFGSDNPFGGIALLLAAQALPNDLDFIKKMEVQPKIKIPSLQSLTEYYISSTRRAGSPSQERISNLTERHKELIRRLPSNLNDYLSKVLAIEMHRARLNSKDSANKLLDDLLVEFLIEDLEMPIEEFINKGVIRFLDSRSNLISSYQILSAIKRAKESGQMKLKHRGSFQAYVNDAKEWRTNDVEGLRLAESLGFLKWSFLELSSGQVAMLMLFASLAGALVKLASTGKRMIVLAIDEGEMFMHPAWQRTFLSQLMKFLAFYRSQFELVHLIVSTHSLIVAGDTPPNRLFDVVSGEMQNGFAAPPDELLKKVYKVPEFSGEVVEQFYEKISEYLRHGGTDDEAEEVYRLVEKIASERLRNYLQDQVTRRMELPRAQA